MFFISTKEKLKQFKKVKLTYTALNTYLLDEAKVYQNCFVLLGGLVLIYQCKIYIFLTRLILKFKTCFSYKVTREYNY